MDHYPYTSDYFPAAPVLDIYLDQLGQKPIVGPITALVDTGADTTLIPRHYLKQIQAQKVDTSFLRSHWGERRTVFLYAVTITIDSYSFAGPWVVGDDEGDEIVLGRNVLNRMRFLLDGPLPCSNF